VTIATMAIIGFVVGFVLDELIARMAREPYERGDFDDDVGGTQQPPASAPRLDLASEAGAVQLPMLLTTGSAYRRMIVVTATVLVFGLLGRQFEGEDWYLAIAAFYASALIICTATDILAYRVPNSITYPAILAALILGMAMPDANRLDVIAGGLLFGGLLFVPSLLTRGAMGLGDVKLALFTGLALGISKVVPAMLVMALSGGVVALVLLVFRIRGKGEPIPYAPFIAAGALVAMLAQGTAFYDLT
jgi:prepilin signal peptidase PulO-like enzyme (type II secretory pathway)